MTGGYQGCLVADIGDIGTRETWCLTGEEVDIDSFVNLQRFSQLLNFFFCQLEAGFADGRNGAGADRHTHGANIGDHLLGNSLDLCKACACLSHSSSNLVNKDGSCYATTSNGV